MKNDKTTQSIASTTDHRAEAGQSRSQRSFLRKVGAASILGVSGMALATETVSANEADEENRSSHRNSLRIYGYGGRIDYSFLTTGDIDHMGLAEDNDENIEPYITSRDGVDGRIYGGHEDRFAFNGQLVNIYVDGKASIWRNNRNVSD